MASSMEENFRRWAKPPSETEDQKAERVARMVREGLREDDALKRRNFDIVVVGSYRNNTNIRSASDVDLAAVLRDAAYNDLPPPLTREALGLREAPNALGEFRTDLGNALRRRFGSSDVASGRITLSIDATSARLGADVTPYLLHRRYTADRLSVEGIETRPSNAPDRRLIQWPDQHYSEAVKKNDATNRRYKRVVRILKCLRDDMAANAQPSARDLAKRTKSCFIEHAIFNVPNDRFNLAEGSYYEDVRGAITFLWNASRDDTRSRQFVEASRMQPLFRFGEPWSAKALEEFTAAAWAHAGFKSRP